MEALTRSFIKKMDTAEYENFPQNNAGVISINADDVWLAGYDGTGVKVAVLDSGIDTSYAGTEFPASFERMDYSNYPTSTDAMLQHTVWSRNSCCRLRFSEGDQTQWVVRMKVMVLLLLKDLLLTLI